ncbi:hypothetical protein A6M21_12945 [Desulfotomaculum copahuensis]|uniref:DUF302 domain-containing protein n=1 Tax=Desulfotomaculum copahuensis TaxID=1838280 RepID=A0A1B7LCY1_9FIRM|nr:hypothetical protein A6M21_12945 [Desulfotomaculum copahuensis]
MFHYTVDADKDFETAVADLEKALAARKFGVLWKLDVKDKLAEKGVDFAGNFKILEVCNPVKAKEALEGNMQVGYFLPCKMVVFEEKGRIKMGTVLPTAIMGLLEEGVPAGLPQEVEKVLIEAIDAAR